MCDVQRNGLTLSVLGTHENHEGDDKQGQPAVVKVSDEYGGKKTFLFLF